MLLKLKDFLQNLESTAQNVSRFGKTILLRCVTEKMALKKPAVKVPHRGAIADFTFLVFSSG